MALTFSFCLSVLHAIANGFTSFFPTMSGWVQPVLSASRNQLSKPILCQAFQKSEQASGCQKNATKNQIVHGGFAEP